MALIIQSPMKIKCNICSKVQPVDLDFELVHSESRKMGVEFTYQAIYDIVCDCKNNISGEYFCYEYPEGGAAGEDHSEEGCTIENLPKIEIVLDTYSSDDENYIEYDLNNM